MIINQKEGYIRIDEDIYAIIAAQKALETKGVAGMSSTLGDGIAKVVGLKNESEGIRVQVINDDTIAINAYITVQYGYRLPDVALRLQERIKTAIEEMTQTHVSEVNIFVQEILMESTQQTISN